MYSCSQAYVTRSLGNGRRTTTIPLDQLTIFSSAAPMGGSGTTKSGRHLCENKCKVFAWILIHDKILTADNLQRRGWPHQERCVLCDGPLETGLHLSLLCPYVKAVWNQILDCEHFDIHLPQPQHDPLHIHDWWEEAAKKVPKEERRCFNGMAIYTF
jgi:hypothetical protein